MQMTQVNKFTWVILGISVGFGSPKGNNNGEHCLPSFEGRMSDAQDVPLFKNLRES